jgi:hypothetical protein
VAGVPSPQSIVQLWVSFDPTSATVVCAETDPWSGIAPGVTARVAVGATFDTVSVPLATTSMLTLSLTVSVAVHVPSSVHVMVVASAFALPKAHAALQALQKSVTMALRFYD